MRPTRSGDAGDSRIWSEEGDDVASVTPVEGKVPPVEGKDPTLTCDLTQAYDTRVGQVHSLPIAGEETFDTVRLISDLQADAQKARRDHFENGAGLAREAPVMFQGTWWVSL